METVNIIRSIKNSLFIRNCWVAVMCVMSFFRGKRQFAQCSDNVTISPPLIIDNPKNVFLGPAIGLGPHAYISAINAKFICKGHCAIAERLTVHTGNHARVVGMYVTEITEANKPIGYDKDVLVEEDVWIGSNVTLLSGATIGRGTTVAAGAVVTKPMPPYCVCGGVPAKFIKFYWTIDQILEHESKLYSKEERYTRKQLERIFAEYILNNFSSRKL